MNNYPFKLTCTLVSVALALSACSSPPTATTISSSGTSKDAKSIARMSAKGSLKVYSAESWHTREYTYSYAHSEYQILTSEGRVYRHIANASLPASEEPEEVSIPAGNYVVVAQAAKRGTVSVPVTIEAGRLTQIHLD